MHLHRSPELQLKLDKLFKQVQLSRVAWNSTFYERKRTAVRIRGYGLIIKCTLCGREIKVWEQTDTYHNRFYRLKRHLRLKHGHLIEEQFYDCFK